MALQDLHALIDQVRPETARLLHDIALQDVSDAHWNRQVGPFLAARDVARLLGRAGRPLSRQAVAQRRDLLAIRAGNGATVYPIFQFAGRRTLPGMREVLAALEEVAQPLTIASWLTTAHPDLDGRTPAAALRDGDADAVVRAARALAAGLAA